MSTRADALIQKAERGERVARIREALGLTGEKFGELLTREARKRRMSATYDKGKVSRMESGERKVTVEEVAILTELDPERRPVAWLVFGEPKPRASEPRERRVG